MSGLVILDRDGVINEDSPDFVKSPSEWHPIPGSLAAIARLHRAGFRMVIFTNQSGIARGLLDLPMLERIHAKLLEAVAQAGGAIAGIYFCPHGPGDACACRKPLPGMLERIREDFGVSLTGVPVIGDSRRDLQAAAAVGARPMLVLTGNGRTTQQSDELPAGTEIYRDLAAVAEALIEGWKQ